MPVEKAFNLPPFLYTFNILISPTITFLQLPYFVEYPFIIRYWPGKSQFIKAVDACSRAPVEPAENLGPDPMDRPSHGIPAT